MWSPAALPMNCGGRQAATTSKTRSSRWRASSWSRKRVSLGNGGDGGSGLTGGTERTEDERRSSRWRRDVLRLRDAPVGGSRLSIERRADHKPIQAYQAACDRPLTRSIKPAEGRLTGASNRLRSSSVTSVPPVKPLPPQEISLIAALQRPDTTSCSIARFTRY